MNKYFKRHRTVQVVGSFCNNNKKKVLFTSKLDEYSRKKPVKCCIWSIALCGAETWTLRELDRKDLENL